MKDIYLCSSACLISVVAQVKLVKFLHLRHQWRFHWSHVSTYILLWAKSPDPIIFLIFICSSISSVSTSTTSLLNPLHLSLWFFNQCTLTNTCTMIVIAGTMLVAPLRPYLASALTSLTQTRRSCWTSCMTDLLEPPRSCGPSPSLLVRRRNNNALVLDYSASWFRHIWWHVLSCV